MSTDPKAPVQDMPAEYGTGPPTGGRAYRWFFRALLVLLLALYAVFLLSRFAPAISNADANGYWAQGSLLFTTGHTWFVPESDSQYIGRHWLLAPSGRYYSRFPPGLPVLIGLVYRTFGYKASVLVQPVLALLSLAGLYLLLSRVMSAGWAVAGVFVLATNPVFSRDALAGHSHMAVTLCLIWGMYLLMRWSVNGHLWEIFTAGVFLGAIPTIRYPEALFGLGAGVFLLWHYRSHPRIWLHYLAAAGGAALLLVPLLIRNQLAFGAFWRTAYAFTNEQTAFGLRYLTRHFVDYVCQLNGDGIGLLLALGVMGMTVMCGVRRWRALGVLLVLLTVPTTLLYMSYYWASRAVPIVTMRFLLPTFVCYILAGLWFLSQGIAPASARVRRTGLAVILILQGVWGGSASLNETGLLHHRCRALALITDALEKSTQHGDVIMAHPQILQHLDFVRHWRLAESPIAAERLAFDSAPGKEQDPNAPKMVQEENRKVREEKYKGLGPAQRERNVAEEIQRWAGRHKVYYVGTEQGIRGMQGPCFESGSFKIVAHVTLPQPPPMSRRGGFAGGGTDGSLRLGFPAKEKDIMIAEWTLPYSGEKK